MSAGPGQISKATRHELALPTALPNGSDAARAPLIVQSPREVPPTPVFADLSDLVEGRVRLLAKIEFLNPAGSIKLKPASALLQTLSVEGRVRRDSIVVDTSSGNMGIALSMAARSLGLSFLCVTDEKITPHNKKLMEAYGATVHVIPGSNHRDRCKYITELEASDDRFVWTKQFEDRGNPRAHEFSTAEEIFQNFPKADAVFVGVGTGGTLAGCAAVRERLGLQTRIVAVDPVGSRHFTNDVPKAARLIPGIGATERSPFLDTVKVDDVVWVDDAQTVRTCLEVLNRTGWMLGGSSGSVLHAAMRAGSSTLEDALFIAICADSGERYLDTIYDPEWRARHRFGDKPLDVS